MTVVTTPDPETRPVSATSPLYLAPKVGLEELDALASLQTRVDRKYVIPAQDLDSLLWALVDDVRILEIDGRRTFGYESTYHDTPELQSYLAAARSRPNRYKVRTRSYLDTDRHVLEVKTRDRRGRTSKQRSEGSHDRHVLDAGGRRFVLEAVRAEVPALDREEFGAEISSLIPTLRTSYRRTTLLLGAGAEPLSRTTIDTSLVFADLRSAGDLRRKSSSFHPGIVIVETKTTGQGSAVDRLLWRSGHRPVKISKYGTGLALLRPELPAAKWNRLLRRHFGWRPANL